MSSLAPALVLVGVLGVGAIFCQVSSVTLLQRSAENEVMGRVFAVLESLCSGRDGASARIATPGLVSWLGPRGALIAAGSLLPVLLVWLWPSLRRIDAEAVIAEEPLELLRKIEIFAELPEPVLERLAAGATPISVAAGQVVVSRGEVGNHFYVDRRGHGPPSSSTTGRPGSSGPATSSARSPCCATSRGRRRCGRSSRSGSSRWSGTSSSPP